MATMKAVRIHAYGGPEVLVYEAAPRPEPAADEVLLRIHAAGVNPADWKTREGFFKASSNQQLPIIIGGDVAGVIEAVGSGVTDCKAGDAVYAMTGLVGGGYAEYVTLPSALVSAKPQSLDFVHAAAVPVAATTAWQALFDAAKLSAGQKVLIHAGAGGVGSFAVQFARYKGAHVITTASARNTDFLRELGADEVIDYSTTRFEDAVHDVDAVFDTLGGDTQERSLKVLKRGGVLVSVVGLPFEQQATAQGINTVALYAQPNRNQLTEIGQLIDAGQVKVTVEKVLPLQEAREAHELSQSGHTRGKIVLQVAS